MIFVAGSSRSGTTLMSRILGRHPDVFAFHELHFFEQLWTPDSGDRELDVSEATDLASVLLHRQRKGFFERIDTSTFHQEAEDLIDGRPMTPIEIYRRFLYAESSLHGKRCFCEHTPRNLFYIPEILNAFPEARVIVMIRDPRSILYSQKLKWKRRFLGARNIPLRESIRSLTNYHPFVISKLISSAYAAAAMHEPRPKVRVVRYEDLVDSPGSVIGEVLEFLGLEAVEPESLLDVPDGGSSYAHDGKRTGISPERKESWRGGGLGSTEIWICQKMVGGQMEAFGYRPVEVRPSILRLLVYAVSLLPQALLILLLNLNRAKSLKEAVLRRLRRRG